MLNTATWTPSYSAHRALHATGLIPNLDQDALKPISARGITHESPPSKPYVYGQSSAWARRQLARVQATLNVTTPV